MKILLVDDCNTTRRIARKILEDLGYFEVTDAGDGAEAVRKLETEKFDLVFLDWNMPIMNGIETLNILKSNPITQAIPTIMVSGELGDEKQMEAMDSGAEGFIFKPATADDFQIYISKFPRVPKIQN